jgi:photosystem II stability/assembly factor-like uncharacterized protein
LLGLVAAMSCAGTPETPAPGQTPPARVEWLLPSGALLNAVALLEAGAGAAVGEFGAIFVTGDGGVTWAAAESATSQSLRGVAFANATTGVAAGAGGTVLRTEDAGRSWTVVDSGTGVELRAVAFASPAVALVVGENGTVLRSDDAGRTWHTAASGTTSTLRAVRFASASVAVAVGDDGALLQSVDAGATWQRRESGTSAALRGVCFSDASTGVVVGGDDRRWRAERVALRTTDGGATWTRTDVPPGARLYSVIGTGLARFVAAGEAGATIRTTDGGQTWSVAGAAVAGTTRAGSFPLDTSNWIASVASWGSAVVSVTYGGRIQRSTDAGATWTQVPKPVITANVAAVARAGQDAFVAAAGGVLLRSAGGGALEQAQTPAPRGGGTGPGAGGGSGGAQAGQGGVLSLSFPSPLVGIATGIGGAILRTVDGGRTWTAVESGTKRPLRGVAFADDKVGIAVAGPAGAGAGMIRTDDGGLTWHEQPCVPGTNICTSDNALLAVALLPSQVGMAVGGRALQGPAVLIKTADGGRSWTRITPGLIGSQLRALALIDERTALAVGTLGMILHTLDGGATWIRRDSGTPLNLSGIAFANASRGLIVGECGTVLVTGDGGVTWRREPPRTTRDLSAVQFQDAHTAIITGTPGVVLRHTWTTDVGPLAAGVGRGGSHD